MAILQISKIQQRSGNLVDLPQLDDAEFGFASDAKRLFIGKSTPNENIEVLTSYSQINFSQINGTVGNLNISNINLADGQVLAYDGSEWVNKGGDAGGLLTLGDVSNVRITGGAIGYVLETDGLGNLSWTPKSSIVSYIENVTSNAIARVTTTQENFFTQGAEITITDVTGMIELNGNVFYVDVITSNTFDLYSDSGLSTPVDSTGYGAFPYSTVSATTTVTDQITVANSAPFTVNDPVVFAGNLGNSTIDIGQVYYITATDTVSNTWIKISETEGGNIFDPGTEASTSGARVYVTGGRAVSLVSGSGGGTAAGGANTQIQYNNTNTLDGDANFTYNDSTKLLTLGGNANVGNLNATGVTTATQFISNIATGTAPFTVTSTTQVANLNVATAGTVTTAAQPNITSVGNLTTLVVTGNANVTGNLVIGGTINSTGNITAPTFFGNIVGNISGNIVVPGSNGEVIFNNAGNAGASNAFSFNTSSNTLSVNGTITAPAFTANTGIFTGNGSGLTNIAGANVTGAVSFATTANAVAGANVSGAVSFATTANAVAGANVSGQVGNALVSGTVYTAAQPNITSVGTLTSLGVSGALTTTQLTAGANTTAGNITGNWTLTAGSRLTATYADLAEYYEADVKYLPGTVLMFGGDKEVTLAEDGTSKVAGVVSTNPAYVMNATCPGLLTAVALQGRVPCKVRGKISKGDMLISGGNGFARPNQFPAMGTVIGKALQDFDGYEGVIEVAVGRL